jgi:hypothetical protein
MSLRSTGSWFPLPALVGVVVLFPLALLPLWPLPPLRTPASATAAPRLSPFRAFAAPAPFPRLTVLAAPAPATPLLILFLILKFQLYLGFGGLLPSLLCVALFPSAPVSATSSLLMFLPCTSVEPCGCCLSLYLGSW